MVKINQNLRMPTKQDRLLKELLQRDNTFENVCTSTGHHEIKITISSFNCNNLMVIEIMV